MNQTIIEVSLDSDDGQCKVLDIYETKGSGGPDGKDGVVILRWDAANIDPGLYRIRWTLRGEY